MKTIEVAHDIQARKTQAGTWQIKHPGRDGRMTNWYSTGIEGSERDLRRHVKEAKLEDIVALGQRNALSDKVLSQFTRGTPRRTTIEGVRDEWINWMRKVGKAPRTIETCTQNFDRWIKTCKLGKKSPLELNFDDIYEFVNPEGSTVGKKTREIRLFAIRCLFQYLLAHNYCPGNPAAAVNVRQDLMGHGQKEAKRVESFTQAEFKRMISYFDKEIAHIEKLLREDKRDSRIHKPVTRLRWLQFFRFGSIMSWEIGLRLGDICQLEWVCFSNPEEVVVHTDKRDTRIAVPMSDTMKAAFRKLNDPDDLDYLFPMQRELILGKSRSRPSDYFKKELEKAGIKGKTFHALRHTCIRRMKKDMENGTSLTPDEILRRIGRVVAHANSKTTEGYL